VRTFGADGQRSKNEKIKLPLAHEIQGAGNGPRLAETQPPSAATDAANSSCWCACCGACCGACCAWASCCCSSSRSTSAANCAASSCSFYFLRRAFSAAAFCRLHSSSPKR
jgi:hypothetical protein